MLCDPGATLVSASSLRRGGTVSGLVKRAEPHLGDAILQGKPGHVGDGLVRILQEFVDSDPGSLLCPTVGVSVRHQDALPARAQ